MNYGTIYKAHQLRALVDQARDGTLIEASRPAKRRAEPEELLQMAVCQYLAHALDSRSVFFAVPNGGKRRLSEARRFKATGVVAGVPDLIIACEGRMIGIELKAGKNVPTKAQIACHAKLRDAGVPVYTCRSIDEVEAALRECGVPLFATTRGVR